MSKVLSAHFLAETLESRTNDAPLIPAGSICAFSLFTQSNLLQTISQVAGLYASLHADACKPCADSCGTPRGKARATEGWSAQTCPRAEVDDTLDNHRWGRASRTTSMA